MLGINSEKFQILEHFNVVLDGGGKRDISCIKNKYKRDELKTDNADLQVFLNQYEH